MFIFICRSAWTPLSYMFTKLSFYAVLRPATCICAKKCPPFMRSRANKAYCLPLLVCVTVTFTNQFIIATCVKLYGPHGKTCHWRYQSATLPRKHSTGNSDVNFKLSTWRLDSSLTSVQRRAMCISCFWGMPWIAPGAASIRHYVLMQAKCKTLVRVHAQKEGRWH